MQVLNLGSINIDHVYAVDHFVKPGETLDSLRYDVFAGGKGFNQSIALARAGADTRHAGKVGRDAAWLLERLALEDVDVSCVREIDVPTGHAVIQVNPSGENAIVLYGGANREVTGADIRKAMASVSSGDCLLLQNEVSSVPEAMHAGKRRGLTVVFNPAPMASDVQSYPLECVDLFILNETEAEGLTGQRDVDTIREVMGTRYPGACVVLTLGAEGAVYFDRDTMHRQAATPVRTVDSTAAGDTFIGYFLAGFLKGEDPSEALSLGCRAAAICVTRPGASDSIPLREDL